MRQRSRRPMGVVTNLHLRVLRPCPERMELPVPRRPANALCIETGKPLARCRLKVPASWGDADPRAARWLLSGGDPLVLGRCSSECPKTTPPVAHEQEGP